MKWLVSTIHPGRDFVVRFPPVSHRVDDRAAIIALADELVVRRAPILKCEAAGTDGAGAFHA